MELSTSATSATSDVKDLTILEQPNLFLVTDVVKPNTYRLEATGVPHHVHSVRTEVVPHQ